MREIGSTAMAFYSGKTRTEDNTGAIISFSAAKIEIKDSQIKLLDRDNKLVASIISAPDFKFEEIKA
jgi:hypothetical protein